MWGGLAAIAVGVGLLLACMPAPTLGVVAHPDNGTLEVRGDFSAALRPGVVSVYAYVTATWATPAHPVNRAIVWERTITDRGAAVFAARARLRVPGPATLTAAWSITPVAGPIMGGSAPPVAYGR